MRWIPRERGIKLTGGLSKISWDSEFPFLGSYEQRDFRLQKECLGELRELDRTPWSPWKNKVEAMTLIEYIYMVLHSSPTAFGQGS